jgi:hypothetical protein
MDVIAASIEDAKVNVPDGIYEVGTAETVVPKWVAEGFRATALIVDPPRTGLDDKLLDTIIATQPEKWFMCPVMCRLWRVIWLSWRRSMRLNISSRSICSRTRRGRRQL